MRESKDMAITKAKRWINEGCLILDTETTGLGADAEVIEISIINHLGEVLIDTLVKPLNPIPAEATEIHGITNAMVEDAPTWPQIHAKLFKLMSGKLVVVYNADYDERLIFQTLKQYPDLYYIPANYRCAMLTYADFYGEWDDYRGKYRWQRLGNAARQCEVVIEGQQHRALSDCRTTLGVINAMAGAAA